MKKIIGLILVLCLACGATTALAASPSVEGEQLISIDSGNATVVYEDSERALVEYSAEPRGAADYGSAWQNGSGSGSFTVKTSYSGTLGFTFGLESSSSDSWVTMSVTKPDGNKFGNDVLVDTSKHVYATARNASSGTYTVRYSGYTPTGMRVMCWIYKK